MHEEGRSVTVAGPPVERSLSLLGMPFATDSQISDDDVSDHHCRATASKE
jgi:hypothetical protein